MIGVSPAFTAQAEIADLKERLNTSRKLLAVLLDELGGTFELSQVRFDASDGGVTMTRFTRDPGKVFLHRTTGQAVAAVETQEAPRG